MRPRSPFSNNDEYFKSSERLVSTSSSIIHEKIVEKNGEVTYKRYKKGRFLGKGGFAKVYEITD